MIRDEIATDWPSIIAVTLGITAFATAQGLTYPLLSFLLKDAALSEGLIGLHAAAYMVGLVVSVLTLPALNAYARAGTLIVAGLAIAAAALVGFALTENLIFWFFLRFVLGYCVNTIYVLGEAWLNAAANDRVRGRVTGVYGAGMSFGFAIGPLGLAVFGTEDGLAFSICASFVALVAMLFAILARRAKAEPEPVILREIGAFFTLSPHLIVLVIIFGIFDSTAIAILPLYFVNEGLTQGEAAIFVTVIHVGMIVAQPALGWLLDRVNRWAVAIGCLAATSLSFFVLLYIPVSSSLLWLVSAAAGAAFFGVYTSALTLLGQIHTGSTLVAGSAAFAMAYALGGIAGPATTGALLAINASWAFWFLIAVSTCAAAILWRKLGRS